MKQDQELLQAWLAHEDRDALGELFGRHYPAVYQVVLRLVHHETDARDVVQSTFLKALRKADTIRQPDRLRFWLLRIAVNEARQHHRRARPAVSLDDLADVFEEARRATVEHRASRREFELALEQALETMPERLKTPLVLHYYQSLSLAEVAHILELPKSTVQSRCERAVRLLRKRFRRSDNAALLPGLAAYLPDLASTASTSAVPLAAGALLVKVWIPIAAVVFALAWFLVGALQSGDPDRNDMARDPSPQLGDLPADAATNGAPRLQPTDRDPPREPDVAKRVVASEGPGRIRGRVVALRTGRGVSGAEIRLVRSAAARSAPREAASFENVYVSGPDGRFVCDELPAPDVFDLCVRHPDFGYAEAFAVPTATEGEARDLGVVFLRAPHRLEGRVVDERGKPVAGADVRAGTWREQRDAVTFELSAFALRGATTTSDAAGRFALDGLPAGVHRLRIDRTGYATALLGAVRVPDAGVLDVVLLAQSNVLGRIVDDAGEAVEGARIMLSISESRRRGAQGVVRTVPWKTVRSDAGGRFPMSPLPGGEGFELVVEASHPGHADLWMEQPIPQQGVFEVTLQRRVIPSGHRVRVTPVVASGAIARDAKGRLVLLQQEGDLELAVAFDADRGLFEIDDVAPGAWYARLAVSGFAPVAQSIDVGDGPLELNITLQRGRTLRGRILDAVTGEPIAGATIGRPDSEAHVVVSDETGAYLLPGLDLAEGRLHVGALHAYAPGYLARGVNVRWPSGDVAEQDVKLLPRSALVSVPGTVTVDGQPVLGARVALQPTRGSSTRYGASSRADGSFRLTGLHPDHLAAPAILRVDHPRFAPHTALRVVAAGEPLQIVLESGRSVSGRVVDIENRPVAGATVGFVTGTDAGVIQEDQVWALSGRLQRAGTSMPDGRFVLDRVPSGAGRVLAFHQHGRWVAKDGDAAGATIAAAGDVDGVELRLEIGRTLRGVVVDDDGRPLAGARVRADGVVVATRTDARGRFDLTPHFGGEARVTVTVTHERYRAAVNVPAPDLSRVRVQARATGTIAGRVVAAGGNPLSGMSVRLVYDDPPPVRAVTDADGVFVLAGVYAGRGRIELRTNAEQDTADVGREVDIPRWTRLDLGDLVMP